MNPFNQSLANAVHQRLRSASSLDFIVPWTRTKFGDRAFSVVGPTVRNSLPESVRSAKTLASFKHKPKSICSTFRFNLLLSLINIVMPSRSGLVVGWAPIVISVFYTFESSDHKHHWLMAVISVLKSNISTMPFDCQSCIVMLILPLTH